MHRLRKHGVKPDFLDSGKRESKRELPESRIPKAIPETEREELNALKAEVQKLKLERERLLRQLELAETERSYYRERHGFDPYAEERAARQSQMLLNDPLIKLEYAQLLKTYRQKL